MLMKISTNNLQILSRDFNNGEHTQKTFLANKNEKRVPQFSQSVIFEAKRQ